jgi:hypothetical protein
MPTSQEVATAPESQAPSRIALFGPPPLIEGEDAAAYDELHARVSSAIRPSDFIEEIFIRDVVDDTWTVFRFRRLQAAFLSNEVSDEVFKQVSFLDELLEVTPEEEDRACLITQKSNIDVNKIQATVIARRLDTIERMEHWIAIAEGRRNATLREIERHRAGFARMLRERIDEIEDAEFKIVGLKETVAADTSHTEAE